MTDKPLIAPSIDDANQELLVIQVQTLPAQIRAAFLQGVIAGRQAEKPARRAKT
ncbi:MAG TPA: hypothetical protein VIK61_08700 [Acidimicrobiia bacterium]